jgi:hypothetical protein
LRGRTGWAYPVSVDLNFLNRRMRTRSYGGVAGEERKLSPLCRFPKDRRNALRGAAAKRLESSSFVDGTVSIDGPVKLDEPVTVEIDQ